MTVENSTVEEHNEEERFLASLSLLDIVQGIQHFQLTSMLASELPSEYVTLQVGKSFWMGLYLLESDLLENILLLSTAAVCSCTCVVQTKLIQVTDCLAPFSSHRLLYLVNPFAAISHSKCPEGSHP